MKDISELTFKQLICFLFLEPDDNRTNIFLEDKLKIRVDRKINKDTNEYSYDGVLMKDISRPDETEDWRVATCLSNKPIFSCIDEEDLLNSIVDLLNKFKKNDITFFKKNEYGEKVRVLIHFEEADKNHNFI